MFKLAILDQQLTIIEGSILGPLIFIIYINDMHIASKYFAFIMYADDTTLLHTIKPQDFNNPQQLAAEID